MCELKRTVLIVLRQIRLAVLLRKCIFMWEDFSKKIFFKKMFLEIQKRRLFLHLLSSKELKNNNSKKYFLKIIG